MKFANLLREIRDLGLYPPDTWEEYASCFEGGDTLAAQPAARSLREGGELSRRIAGGEGARPAVPDFGASPKIVTAEELAEGEDRKRITLGVVSGAFDLLHLGHLRGMREAREALDARPDGRLCAMTLSDRHIRRKKGDGRPVLNVNERLAMLAAVRFLDYVVPLDEPDCLKAIETLRPEIFFKSNADRAQPIVRQELDLVERRGGRVRFFRAPEPQGMSTTAMVCAVRQRLRGEDFSGKGGESAWRRP